MASNLGYCCINLSVRDSIYTGRTCREKDFTMRHAGELALKNCEDLIRIIEWNERSGIKVFRVSSHMFPHATNPKMLYSPDQLPTGSGIVRALDHAGALAKKYGHVLAMHPPHFVSLASDDLAVQHRSVQELEHHEWIASHLQASSVNWHFGRSFDPNLVPVFVNNWNKLPQSLRDRACIENDDKQNCWSVTNLYEHLWPATGAPICFDAFHWYFCHNQDREEDFRLAKSTWSRRMECHISSGATQFPLSRTHNGYITDVIPEYLLDPSVYLFVEAGMKELAVFEYARRHNILINPSPWLALP